MKKITDHKHEMVMVLVSVAQASVKDENYDQLITRAFEIMEDYKHKK